MSFRVDPFLLPWLLGIEFRQSDVVGIQSLSQSYWGNLAQWAWSSLGVCNSNKRRGWGEACFPLEGSLAAAA